MILEREGRQGIFAYVTLYSTYNGRHCVRNVGSSSSETSPTLPWNNDNNNNIIICIIFIVANLEKREFPTQTMTRASAIRPSNPRATDDDDVMLRLSKNKIAAHNIHYLSTLFYIFYFL